MPKSILCAIRLVVLGALFALANGETLRAETSATDAASKKAEGEEVYFKLNLADPKVRAEIESRGAKVVNQGPNGELCFEATVPVDSELAGAGKGLMISFPFNVRQLRGCYVVIEGMVQGENLSKPHHLYNGAKCQAVYTSQITGQQFADGGGIYGTFPWRKSSSRFLVADDAAGGTINLGMQECSGTVRIADVKIKILARKPVRPAPVAELDHKVTQYRGFMSPISATVEEKDYQDMRAWGANCIRWHLDGSPADLENYEAWLTNRLDQFEKALNLAQANGIKIVIDLHLLPGGRETDGTMRLVLEKKYQDQLVALWERIAKRFKDHPALWAYDLINEPVQNVSSPEGVDNWMALQIKVAKAVRKIDTKTPIMIEVDGWDGPEGFQMLMPVDVPNVIYQVHMYWPGEFTHQGVHTNQGIALGKDVRPTAITYPGRIRDRMIDKEMLRAYLQPVRDFQRAYNIRIFVGEFSAVRWAPGAAQYLDDCISIFEEYGWDWAYHAFREWHGWSAEHDEQFWVKGTPNPAFATEETERAKVLKKAMSRNAAPVAAKAKD